MFKSIIPKLPMRNKAITKQFYTNQLGFIDIGIEDFQGYLLLQKDEIEIHFFEFQQLNPNENYGQIYIRIENIEKFYQSILDINGNIHPNGQLQIKPWRQIEFAMLDPDNNLITFGQSVD